MLPEQSRFLHHAQLTRPIRKPLSLTMSHLIEPSARHSLRYQLTWPVSIARRQRALTRLTHGAVAYSQRLWQMRFFWLSLVRKDILSRYRHSLLGVGWSLLQPIAMTTVICIAFHSIFRVSIRQYAPFLLVGLSVWSFLSSVMLQGCQSFRISESYIRQFPAPLAIYSLRMVLVCGFHFIISLSVVVLLSMALRGFSDFAALLTLVPTAILLFLIGWSLATIAGLATAIFPDVPHLAEVSLQLLFYATPVMYPAEALKGNAFGWLLAWNPVAVLLDLVREPVLNGTVVPFERFAVGGLMALALMATAIGLLWRLERKFVYFL